MIEINIILYRHVGTALINIARVVFELQYIMHQILCPIIFSSMRMRRYDFRPHPGNDQRTCAKCIVEPLPPHLRLRASLAAWQALATTHPID